MVDHASKSMSLAIESAAQLTSQNRFKRSLSNGYKMTNGSRVCKLFFKNGRKSNQRSIVCGRQQWVSGNSQSMSMLRMAMANDSPNLIRSSAMSDVFIVIFTFLVFFWLVTCTSEWSDPHGFFAKWSSLALPLRACSNLSACGIFCLTHSKFSYN